MATKPSALPTPLAISKSEQPKNGLAKSAMGIVTGTVGRVVKTLKTPIALREFWICLGAWCSRNVAEIDGMTTAAPPGRPWPTPNPAASVKRPHRKTDSATA